jgi:hypothetical protein
MNNDQEVIQHLEDLAHTLQSLGVRSQFHLLVSGGAYMLLQQARRATEDIDFALITGPNGRVKSNQLLQVTIQRAELSKRSSRVPDAPKFRQAVAIVAERAGLDADFMNDESAVYLYDDAPQAEAVFWRSFANILYIYLPTKAYVFALKMAAFRAKDQEDIQVLIRDLDLQTRAQAQAILNQFLLPEAQKFWQVSKKLKRVFPS